MEADRTADIPAAGDTAAKLLKVAAAIFADRGFRDTRVREVADKAGANVAAINYHFGSKENLYLAVLRSEASRVIERYPITPAQTVQPDADAAVIDAVSGLLSRFLAEDATSYAPRLLVREMLNPTPALDQLVEQITRPQFEQVFAAVSAVLGPAVPMPRAWQCSFSLIGQCLFYLVARPVVERMVSGFTNASRVESLARDIATFSLGGLHAVRREYEEKADA